MITMVPRADVVSFEHNGKQYQMTREEIDAAYHFARSEIDAEDAAYQLKHFVFGVWGVTADDVEAARGGDSVYAPDLDNFEDEYGISYEEAKKHLSAFAARYNANHNT